MFQFLPIFCPLQVRIYFRDLKVEIPYVWFSLQTLRDTANYNLALNDSVTMVFTMYTQSLCSVT